MTPAQVEALGWPRERLGEALSALAAAAGLAPLPHPRPAWSVPPDDPRNGGALDRWIDEAASFLDLDLEHEQVRYSGVTEFLARLGPALVRVPETQRFVAIVATDPRRVVALAVADGEPVQLPLTALERMLRAPFERRVAQQIEPVLDAVAPGPRRDRARQALYDERLRDALVGGIWLFDRPLRGNLWQQARRAALPRRLALLGAAHATQYAVLLASWALLGRAALEGRYDPGWLVGWVLLLLAHVPLAALSTALQGEVAGRWGALIKHRLLRGALALRPDELRADGVSGTFARVMESVNLENRVSFGGLAALTSAIELLLVGGLLALGATGPLHAGLLAAWVAVTAWLALRLSRQQRRWSQVRLGLTEELVESMVGYRTRLAQEDPRRRHEGDEDGVTRYRGASVGLDRLEAGVLAWVPRGWLCVGVAALAPAWIWSAPSKAGLAVSLGATLLAFRSLRRLASAVVELSAAFQAWERLRPLYLAADRREQAGLPLVGGSNTSAPVLEARGLSFRYRSGARPVIDDCSLELRKGDRVLLDGRSGGGKSTLVSILSGWREGASGVLLAGGLDLPTIGRLAWRRRIVAAPQFNDNYVFTGTFAYNLLMSRRWPPTPEDRLDAEAICRELGLGPLLDAMPAGLDQLIGETGWQLSHGERSRLFIARALLQQGEVLLLDESFGALDPETLGVCVRAVMARAQTLVVLAHR